MKTKPSLLIVALVGIVGLWCLFLVSAITMYPLASQNNKAHRLGEFSAPVVNIFNLLHAESQELTSSYLPSSNDGPPTWSRTSKQQHSMELARHNLIKMWGRFNAQEFGSAFISNFETALLQLEVISSSKASLPVTSQELQYKLAEYHRLITSFSAGLYHFGQLHFRDEKTVSARDGLVSALKLLDLLVNERVYSVAQITGNRLSTSQLKSWSDLMNQRRILVERLANNKSPGKESQSLETEAESNLVALARTNKQLFSDAVSGARSPYGTGLNWRVEFTQANDHLLSLANNHHWEMLRRADSTAARASMFYVLSFLCAALATLGLIAWLRPDMIQLAGLFAIIAFNVALTGWAMTAGPDYLTGELGSMESIQALALASAFVLFLIEAIEHPGNSRTAAVVLCTMCFIMFFREFDFRTLNAPEWVIDLTTGLVRRAFNAVTIAVLIVYVALKRHTLVPLIKQTLQWKVWPFLVWLPMLILGEYVEAITHDTRKDDLPGYWANGQFWEELLEMNGYLALLFAALIFAKIYRPETLQKQANPAPRIRVSPASG